MSIIEPKINELLDKSEHDRFLLCSMAAKRAHDISDMMKGQRNRAISTETAKEIATASNIKPLTMAFREIERGDVSYDPATIDATRH
jgi:DNA-directed RNA polymerase subunit omega